MLKNSFGDLHCGAHHRFNFSSNLTNYGFLQTLTCLQNVQKILDQSSIICAVFKTQTFIVLEKIVLAYLTLGKELGITLSTQIEMDQFFILNVSTQKFLEIRAKIIIFHLLETPLKIAQSFGHVRVSAINSNF